MNNISLAFLLTFMAGFSTMLGALVIFIKKKNHNMIVLASLSFAAGVMISVSITDLVPESIMLLKGNFNGVSTVLICLMGIVLGATISMLIDYYLPDKVPSSGGDGALFRVGIISLLAIILHNIPEGIATFVATTSDASLGVSLAIAIAMHNIPEGITIAVPIYYATGSFKKAILYTLVSAISEPFGALITYLFLKNFISDMMLGILFAVIAGIMMQIAFFELMPAAKRYNNKKIMVIFFIIGVLFMLLKFAI